MAIEQSKLDEWRKLSDAAAHGPWSEVRAGEYFTNPVLWINDEWAMGADFKFIAAARTAVPELLDEVERLRAELADMEAERDKWFYAAEDWKSRRMDDMLRNV